MCLLMFVLLQLRDTFTELFRGNKPEPDTLNLSLSCVVQLSINLVNTVGQPCWRELAELLGLFYAAHCLADLQ